MATKPRESTHDELFAAVDIKPAGKKEDRQEYLTRLVEAVSELEGDDWDNLSEKAQEWYNAAVDAANDGQEIPEPDADDEPDEPEAPAKGKLAPKGASKPAAKASSKVAPEPDDAAEDDLDMDDIDEGMQVRLVTKKGEFSGTVTAVDDDVVTLEDEDGEEREVVVARVTQAYVIAAKKSSSTKRKEAAAAPAAAEKKPRIRGAVSITGRIREIVCGDPSLDRDGVAKQLTKEGLEFNPSTLALQYTEVSRTIECLRAAGKLKK